MQPPVEHPQDEIKRLRRCVNDLVSILALPAMWSGAEPSQIVHTLLDSLVGILRLDLVYLRLADPIGEAPVETARIVQSLNLPMSPPEIGALFNRCFEDDPQRWLAVARQPVGDVDVSVVALRLGLQSEIGLLVAGCRRADFPCQTERLLLSVAANQASIGLQEARLFSQQKRLASELDQRVAQRTIELAQTNEELRNEIAVRKRAEEQLRRSEALLAEGQQLSRVGNFSWLVATGEINWSEQLYRIFEFELGLPVTVELIASRMHPEDLHLLYDMVIRAHRGVSDFDYEHRLLLPDRSVKYLHLIAHGSRDSQNRQEYIGAVQDVTQRRLSEEALAKAREELANVARITSLGVLTASIAHEVNQPLSGIITNAGTCLRMLSSDPPNVEGARETARRTIRDGNRASDVITRLRALYSKRDISPEPMDLNEATREVTSLSLSELQSKSVILRHELADGLPPVSGDRVQLQQVILNLLRNASDAMSAVDDRPRELLIKTECDQADCVRLSVKDAGVGFTPQAADKLFQAFHTTKTDGMGIGLSISRSIIEAHRGRLWATANDGPGATFSFSIPSTRDNPAASQPRFNQTDPMAGAA